MACKWYSFLRCCFSVDIAPFVDDFGSTYEGCTNNTSVFESLFLPSGYYLFQVDGVSSNGQVTVCFTAVKHTVT